MVSSYYLRVNMIGKVNPGKQRYAHIIGHSMLTLTVERFKGILGSTLRTYSKPRLLSLKQHCSKGRADELWIYDMSAKALQMLDFGSPEHVILQPFLHWAAGKKATRLMRFLIDHGADVNVQFSEGTVTPRCRSLQLRIKKNHTACHLRKIVTVRPETGATTSTLWLFYSYIGNEVEFIALQKAAIKGQRLSWTDFSRRREPMWIAKMISATVLFIGLSSGRLR